MKGGNGTGKIGERLKKIRLALSMNQGNFSELLGISTPAYVRYELGQRMPRLGLILKLHARLGVDLDWLLTGEGTMFYRDRSQLYRGSGALLGDERVREMLRLMEIPQIRDLVLAHFIEIKYLCRDLIEGDERADDEIKKAG